MHMEGCKGIIARAGCVRGEEEVEEEEEAYEDQE